MPDQNNLKEYRIAEQILDGLATAMARLQKRAVKLGYGDSEIPSLSILRYDIVANPDNLLEVKRYAIVTVTGLEPKIAGWTFAAKIEWLEGGALISTTPFCRDETIPAHFRNGEPICEHCRTSRNRIACFILRSDNGDWKQVGKNCLKDFTGHDSPEQVAAFAEALSEFTQKLILEDCDFEDGDKNMGGYGTGYVSLVRFMAAVVEVVKENGHFITRKQAGESYPPIRSTSDEVLDRTSRANAIYKNENSIGITDESMAFAQAIIEWANAIPEETTSDYLRNLLTVSHCEALPKKHAGLAASMYVAYMRAIEEKRQTENKLPSNHVGEIGKRQTFTLTVNRSRYVAEAQFPFTIYTMQDEQGNICVWKTSSGDLEQGKEYKLKCTIKAHGEYKGAKQTELTRCAVL